MKKGIITAFMAMAFLSFTAYGQNKETRDVEGFTRVSFGISGDLFIRFGSGYSVVLEGDQDDIDEIETEVTSGKLVIRREKEWGFNNMDKVTVHITMPQLEGLGVSGSGKAEIVDQVKDADKLDLNVSGSGKLVAAGISADHLNCGISGSGNVEILQGSADSGQISISGSGNYVGDQMEIDKLEVRISGSGNCSCKAGDSLSASVSGSGNVNYSGSPRLDAHVSGSGKVRSR